MSSTIYGIIKWCTLSPEEITETVNRISVDNIYNGEEFYDEVERLDGWRPATDEDDSVIVWNGDDAGPIEVGGNRIGLFVHYNDDERKFDWACTYELYRDLTDEEINDLPKSNG